MEISQSIIYCNTQVACDELNKNLLNSDYFGFDDKNTIEDFDRVLKCGADKVSVNSGAIRNPGLVYEAAKLYGDQCVVLSADIKRVDGVFRVFAKGGREDTGIEADQILIDAYTGMTEGYQFNLKSLTFEGGTGSITIRGIPLDARMLYSFSAVRNAQSK